MKNLFFLILLIFVSLLFTDCVDRDFDEPPFVEAEDPEIGDAQILSIQDVLSLRQPGEEFHEIGMDMYIRGVVIADDESGNFYKQLVVQDENAGITILLDNVELWNSYKVGRRVFIHLQDLWIGDFNGLPQIGMEPYLDDGRLTMARIPETLIDDVITVGENVGQPEPLVINILDLGEEHLNTLVTLEGVQLIDDNAGDTFANAVDLQSSNLRIEDCNNLGLIMRSSGFATFAGEPTPTGRGNLTGVIGVFGQDQQILIRDLNDVNMEEPRCNEILDGDLITIADLLDRLVIGEETDINSQESIKGTVVSSDETGNFFKSIVIEDETAGITVLIDMGDYFRTYPLGSVVYVKLGGLYISEFSGLPQLGYIQSSQNVKRIPESLVESIIIPTIETEILRPEPIMINAVDRAMINNYVSLENVEFADNALGSTFANAQDRQSWNHTLKDCDGNEIIVRTSGYAEFADDILPDMNGTIEGVLQIFNDDYQLILNFKENINFDNSRCP